MDSAGGGGVLVAIVLIIITAIITGFNTDVQVTPDEMNRANVVCVNAGGLQSLGHDNGGDYTAYCNNGNSYTYQIQEKSK